MRKCNICVVRVVVADERGIDLCGTGVVVVPGMFAVFRSGEKNRFSSSAPIKNIYRKNSSMVGRVFLLRSGYETVQEICAEINRRNLLVNHWNKRPMSLSTVSKSSSVTVSYACYNLTSFWKN